MPITVIHPEVTQPWLAQMLMAQDWTCFRHRGRFWLTRSLLGRRIMSPVSDSLIYGLITKGLAHQRGVRVTATLPFIQ